MRHKLWGADSEASLDLKSKVEEDIISIGSIVEVFVLNHNVLVRKIDEVFCIWKAFGENTHDLGSFGEETDKTTDLHQHLSRLCSQRLEMASPVLHDVVTTHFVTASQPFMTVSAHTTQPKI
ncbi:hypothetical protein Tco_0832334 [Tanacetum coccineum]